MNRIALLSNPNSTGNQSMLPRVRDYCALHEDIFHYEIERVDQIGAALRSIARVRPKVLVVNGGDGTVQAILTELYHGDQFGESPPPVAVLANGKTNLIALDLGADKDPITALERIRELAKEDLAAHIVSRELISLSDGLGQRPVLGMFIGGAGLAETMLYCRNRIYPLGLPNWLAHFITLIVGLMSILVRRRMSFLPEPAPLLKITVMKRGELNGRFALLMVTTLRRILFSGNIPGAGSMQLIVVERSVPSLLRAFVAALRGRLGRHRLQGVHLAQGDEIRIGGGCSSVLMDGELFETTADRSIILRPTAPLPFLKLAA